MRELDLSTRIFRDYNDANRHFKHIEMDDSIVNRYNDELSSSHETSSGKPSSHHTSLPHHPIDSQHSYHHMHSHFTPLALKTDSSQPTHYFWPAIVANSQIHHSQSHSPVSEAPSSPNSSSLLSLKKKSKRKATPIPNESKDEAYWDRRKKNNESAKRSREIRRLKEQQTNSRVVFLEQENLKLKAEVDTLREEIGKLRELFFNNRRRNDDVDQ